MSKNPLSASTTTQLHHQIKAQKGSLITAGPFICRLQSDRPQLSAALKYWISKLWRTIWYAAFSICNSFFNIVCYLSKHYIVSPCRCSLLSFTLWPAVLRMNLTATDASCAACWRRWPVGTVTVQSMRRCPILLVLYTCHFDWFFFLHYLM